MEVKLISKQDQLLKTIYVAARTCYCSGTPNDMVEKDYDYERMVDLVSKVAGSGHTGILEHGNITFAIAGISRACSHQLVRHRHCSFCQQSQRYVEIKESKEEIMGVLDRYENTELRALADKYFVTENITDSIMCIKALLNYRTLIEDDFRKPEDARALLPNATKTNLVVTMNLRELRILAGLRLCTRAQLELRTLVKNMVDEVVKDEAWLKPILQVKCEVMGFCDEEKGCGRKPKLEDILKGK